MMPNREIIMHIINQIKEKFQPIEILIFGSYAKGVVREKSDLDLCIITETDNKRKLVQKMLVEIDAEIDIDYVVYTPTEWEAYKDDPTTFAHIIYSKGVRLIG